jgi:acyl-CoA hydrolase
MPEILADVGDCVEAILRRVGPRIVLALPLGVGKPNLLVNEFYRRACNDASLGLTIITALSLLKPAAASDLEDRLVRPLGERIFGSYVEPAYARDMKHGLPANVRVIEFFLSPGAFLNVAHAQHNYLSANYTHVARAVLARGVNVIAHLVAARGQDASLRLSLGSNADVTGDLLPHVRAARAAGRDIVVVGQTHAQMPYMTGEAELTPGDFDFLVDERRYDYDLFCPPNPAIATAEHAIGMHVSSLVRDGGTLQVGIGELGDALVYALLLRHQQNAAWRAALGALAPAADPALVADEGGDAPFSAGLFANTEMFVDQLLELYRAGILCRRVFDCLAIERVLAASGGGSRFDARILEQLHEAGAGPQLTAQEFETLRRYGVFREEVEFSDGRLRVPGGAWIRADLADPASRERLSRECLGRELRNGQVLHAGFFLGPRSFYAALRELSESDRVQFGMRGVAYVNQLYGADQELRILQRRNARCVNSTMMVTLLGAAVSDGLESGQVVSGVGGQYNFVAMAHELPGARSILCLRATRTRAGRTTSNILWNYGHETIPRHLRDIVVTEYGIADLRGRTDEETIAALLSITDSRFQDTLLERACAAGKLRRDYRIPQEHRANLPGRLAQALQPFRADGYFSEYPFGTDLSREEILLVRALKYLESRSGSRIAKLTTAAAALTRGAPSAADAPALRRMGLDQPRTLAERLQQRLVALGLAATRA